MDTREEQLQALLKDLLAVNAVIATELIQLVENSSRQLRGEIPPSCRSQHAALREKIVAIAERWNEGWQVLREHNLEHD